MKVAQCVKGIALEAGESDRAVRRDPMVRDTIAPLLLGARRDTLGTELRGLAHRAGLTV
ncbi:MAG: hypothetical protein ACRDRS_01420 [Pseudonocardiaceae bacterium]